MKAPRKPSTPAQDAERLFDVLKPCERYNRERLTCSHPTNHRHSCSFARCPLPEARVLRGER